MPHVRALDGLRGIAVLAVVLYHFSPGVAPGGFLGVDVFFVLSGFLITSLLVNERERSSRISLRGFWIRRARRLLPALLLVLLAVGLYAVFVAEEVAGQHMAEDGLASLGYVANWHFIGSGQDYVEQFVREAPSPLRHMWSLAIEEQFYLLWPLMVAGLAAVVARTFGTRGRRAARSRRRFRLTLGTGCVLLGVVSLALMVLLFDERDPNRVYYGTDTRAFLLLLGAAIGALTAGAVRIARATPRVLVIGAGSVAMVALVVLIATVETTATWLYQGGYGLIAVLIALVLVGAAQPGNHPLGRLCSSRPLVGLGLVSYGVYLWHWPITVWLTESETGLDGVALFVLRAVITLAVSLASYWLVEQPIRRNRLPRWSGPQKRIATIIAVTAVAALLAFPFFTFASFAAPPKVAPSRTSQQATLTYATVPRCDGALSTEPPVAPGAPPVAELADARPRVQVVGNSVAVELIPCLGELVKQSGGAIESVAHSAAPPCALIPKLEEQLADPATRPDVAIWFAFDWYYDNSTCNTDWRLWVQEAIRLWKEAGVHVYLIPIVPNVVPSPDPAVYKVVGPDVTVDAPAQWPEFEQWAAEDPTNVTVIDPGMFIRDAADAYQWRMPCLPGGEPGCDADGTVGVRYHDGFHLCTDPAWDGTHCVAEHAAGARRVSAAVALQITELHPNAS